ncbi:MAG TPA: nucleoside triphosphate pyrophosphohydrolase [Arenicellales bacterium]|nr:nucleoside triphosphate pyrophosphohydrolase [Arenicellales bacterium]
MAASINELLEIMARLRDPDSGCPWDVKQDFASIAPYTIEEAYEVSDAIQRGDMDDLREELGDLLLQVVFHSQMAREAGEFDFDDVVAAICRKMVDRHPHVFEELGAVDDAGLRDAWESKKEAERAEKGGHDSALDGVALALPALLRAAKLLRRAARKGFEWPQPSAALAKCREELDELEDAARMPDQRERLEEELGDLLFACASVAAQYGLDAESALRGANAKFERRFRRIEDALRAGDRRMEELPGEELESLWERARTEAG